MFKGNDPPIFDDAIFDNAIFDDAELDKKPGRLVSGLPMRPYMKKPRRR
jgi:hypothetical protein